MKLLPAHWSFAQELHPRWAAGVGVGHRRHALPHQTYRQLVTIFSELLWIVTTRPGGRDDDRLGHCRVVQGKVQGYIAAHGQPTNISLLNVQTLH